MVNPLGLLSAPQHCCLAAALLLTATAAHADPLSNRQQLAGDYFVGASVFLFERTVLNAFAPPDSDDATLDAGAIVLARENAGDESGSVALQAILGWINAWLGDDRKDAEPLEGPPGFDATRRHSLACLAYGADPEVSADLATHAGLNAEARGACIARYAEARKKWTGWLQAFHKSGDGTVRAEPEGAPAEDALVLRLAFAPTMDEADQAIADAMRENGLFQVLTDDLNASLAMPRPITALITQCGEPKAFYNPDRGEAVLCYEMLGALLKTAP